MSTQKAMDVSVVASGLGDTLDFGIDLIPSIMASIADTDTDTSTDTFYLKYHDK